MNNVLNIKKLTKKYPEFVLDNLTLNLPEGLVMGIIGPNGAGKTTAIKLIMNMIKADGGEVEVLGLNPAKEEKKLKNRVGYVGEEQYYYQNKKVSWTGKFVSRFYEKWDNEIFESLLDNFEISRTKKIRELSRGMKVKLSFAIALSHNADLFILDEPTSGLDPIIRREILNYLSKSSQEKNKSVVFSSHITDDVARIADIIAFMDKGKILLSEEKDNLLARYKRIHFKNNTLPDEIEAELIEFEKKMFASSGITSDYPKLKNRLSKGIATGDIKVENVNLDDILIILVNGRQ